MRPLILFWDTHLVVWTEHPTIEMMSIPFESKSMPIKRGSMVRLVRENFINSVEAQASDPRLPSYLFEGTGEVVALDGDYAQVKFKVPTPNVWLRVDQLEGASN